MPNFHVITEKTGPEGKVVEANSASHASQKTPGKTLSVSPQIIGFERVLGGGDCASCVEAASKIYHTEDLMPIHEHCNCGVAPVFGDDTREFHEEDPGLEDDELGARLDQSGPKIGDQREFDFESGEDWDALEEAGWKMVGEVQGSSTQIKFVGKTVEKTGLTARAEAEAVLDKLSYADLTLKGDQVLGKDLVNNLYADVGANKKNFQAKLKEAILNQLHPMSDIEQINQWPEELRAFHPLQFPKNAVSHETMTLEQFVALKEADVGWVIESMTNGRVNAKFLPKAMFEAEKAAAKKASEAEWAQIKATKESLAKKKATSGSKAHTDVEFASYDEMAGSFSEWSAAMDADTREAWSAYIGSDSFRANALLRGVAKPGSFSSSTLDHLQRMTKALDASMTELQFDARVARGLSQEFADLFGTAPEVGGRIVDRGFMSTSTSNDIAEGFAGDGEGAVLEIIVPKGTRAGWMDGAIDYEGGESELVLERGTTLEIVEILEGRIVLKVVPK